MWLASLLCRVEGPAQRAMHVLGGAWALRVLAGCASPFVYGEVEMGAGCRRDRGKHCKELGHRTGG